MGALKAASEKGKLAIGCDSNQNYLYPGTMLTSMLKRGDNAIYDSFMAVKNGSFKGGIVNKGVKDGGIDWALDADNRKLISPELEKKLNAVRADIISGKIKVVDYRENNSCPL
jgi:basic membrane protein A